MLEQAHAQAQVIGRGLECGPLCANVAQFPVQPSTQLLRDHTAFLYMNGGDRLVRLLDDATLAIAKGQTDVQHRARHYAAAVDLLQEYQQRLDRQVARGHATPEQAALLGGYAEILVRELTAAT